MLGVIDGTAAVMAQKTKEIGKDERGTPSVDNTSDFKGECPRHVKHRRHVWPS